MLETSFCELRKKEVVNLEDGKRLGHFIDMVFELNSGRILGFVLPSLNRFFGLFKSNQDIFVPYQSILKIGEDVIMVELSGSYVSTLEQNGAKAKKA